MCWWLDDAPVAADRLAPGPEPAFDDVVLAAHVPLSWTSSQSRVGQVERRAHDAGQPDRGAAPSLRIRALRAIAGWSRKIV